jgi:LuxR family transcriptional regulator, positive regulator of biofilm formation
MRNNLTSRKVFVAGPNTLQNELLASTLGTETGVPCHVVENLAQVGDSRDGAEKSSCLALYDCLGKAGKTCLADLEENGANENFMVALFNLDRRDGFEKQAFSAGVRGFFYRGEPFSLFVKGVAAMFEGELWISRRLLSELVAQKRELSRQALQHRLSSREKEIIRFMAGGATDKEIAEAMFISPHTVKNHLHNIFKKINANSKTQAARWAARHLEV